MPFYPCKERYVWLKVSDSALFLGCTVLCEKPVALSVEETLQLFDIAESCNGILICGFQRRFDRAFQSIKQRLDEIGKLELIRIVSHDYGILPPPPMDCKAKIKEYIFNSVIHDIDLVSFYAGANDSVQVSHATTSFSASPSNPFASTIVLSSNESIAVLEFLKSNSYGYDQRCEVFGSHSTLSVSVCL